MSAGTNVELGPIMSLKTSLRLVGRRISEAVSQYAAAQGWAPEDYVLLGGFDEKTERISLLFGTEHKIDERQCYADMLQAIRSAFPENPLITMNIGLVIYRVDNLDEVYAYAPVGEDEIDLTEMLDRP